MFDVVFVTRLRDRHSFALAQRSVARGLSGAGRIFAVVPDAEVAAFEALPLDAAVVPESRLDPRFAALPSSWFKQQLIKLCVHAIVERPAALILDSDTYLTRPTDAMSLHGEQRTPFFVEHTDHEAHPEWRAGAERTLGFRSQRRWSYFPTPNFVHRDALQVLHRHLSLRWGGDSVGGLIARLGQWTEWAMYGLFVDEVLGEDSPHVPCEVDHVRGVWSRADFDAWTPHVPESVAPDPPLLVVQSILDAPWRQVEAKLAHYPHLARCLHGAEALAHV